MSHAALIVADLLLVAGFTARLTRLIVTDDLGKWWLRDPLDAWLNRRAWTLGTVNRWRKYLDGLACPYCVSFHVAWLVLLSLWLVGGPGHAAEAWRYIAGAFTISYVTAHIGARLGDVADDE
jgi:hypothetical protein